MSNLFEKLESGIPQKIVIFGASASESHLARGRNYNYWPVLLKEELEKKYSKQLIQIIDNSRVGKYSKNGLKKVRDMVIDEKPNAVIIEFVTNDAVNRFDCPAHSCSKRNHLKLIKAMQKYIPECEIILFNTLLPWDKDICLEKCLNASVSKCHNAHYCRRSSRKSSDEKPEDYFAMIQNLTKKYNLYLIDAFDAGQKIFPGDNYKVYEDYVYTGHCTSKKAAEEIIIPLFFKEMSSLKKHIIVK